MDFALLGTGHETFPLLKAIVGNPNHRFVAFVADEHGAESVLNLAPGVRRLAEPTEIIGLTNLGAVIVNSEAPEFLEAARQLAANSVAILLVPHAAIGIEFIYQFGLIRDEQPDQFRLYVIRPARLHPFVTRLRERIQSGSLGQIHQFQWQREIPAQKLADQPALLGPQQTDEALLRDADLLKVWAGEFDQITALQTGDATVGLIQASVSLGGPVALPTQWTCRGTTGAEHWEMTVIGHDGQIALRGTEDYSTMTWSTLSNGKITGTESVTVDWGPALLEEFLSGSAQGGNITETWANDLYRAFDLLEGAHRSLRRRRTVDLYFDTPSERSNFKSTMTAVGCSLLMLTLLTILLGLGAGAIAKDLGLPPVVMKVVRILVFAPLFAFLVLQFGVFLAKPAASTGKAKLEP